MVELLLHIVFKIETSIHVTSASSFLGFYTSWLNVNLFVSQLFFKFILLIFNVIIRCYSNTSEIEM